ncbi:hypothetical protein ABL78_7599 [Leptomonas seymouri]|uniref:Uncharacterized protein n=1 Tax=Leptomonas seymouri TaxID=5684 RepID=A0A0N0P2U6_LEPSE|nr:hypothetical protein ABL78_7599 [Leptomonas seymouri]|eukprot:KPI83369.1 hypothetical protein ABL78_7599 [Leptomonas seymouri]
MSGIVHKESLPGQSHIKRRRVDVPPSAEGCSKTSDEEVNKASAHNETGGTGKDDLQASPHQSGHAKTLTSTSAAAAKPAHTRSSSDSDDDDSDDEIERENARLAKLREQRKRRQEQSSSGATSSKEGAKSVDASCAEQASASGIGANSYDHDVVFRNASWRNSSKRATAEGRQKDRWNAALNRTSDSAAHRHFMKKFFK